MSRDTGLRLIAFGTFTYTIETLIQAGSIGLRVQSVDIGVNPPTRDSRLFKSQSRYVLRAAETIVLTYLVYRPTKLFFLFGAIFGLSGIGLSIRYLCFNAIGEGTGHVQSVIIAGALLVAAIFMFSLAAVAYLLGINRRLLEEIRFRDRDHDFRLKKDAAPDTLIHVSSAGSGSAEPQRVF